MTQGYLFGEPEQTAYGPSCRPPARRKDAAHAILRARRWRIICLARRAMLSAALVRPDRTTTADDAWDAWPNGLPVGIGPKCLGAVPGDLARAGILRAVGYRPTCRAIAHARPLRLWQIVDDAAALAWLDANPDIETGERLC